MILDILNEAPFSKDKIQKSTSLTTMLLELTEFHRNNWPEYKNILYGLDYRSDVVSHYRDLPFLPVSLFKEFELRSIPKEDVFKTMTSSGTSGQAVSRIFLDRETAGNQQKALVKIVTSFLGGSRLPMLIIDSPSVVKDRLNFSARGAGILGFMIFGTDKTYALNDDMTLNIDGIINFLDKHAGKKIMLFGFTFMVWQHFYKELVKSKTQFDLSKGVLIHGGGWKKLVSEAVSSQIFTQALTDVCGLKEVHDYYGMVEQTGSIYMECDQGYLHASNFSDIIVRRPSDFSECDFGEVGIVQVLSPLASSYPGHSLLTEDEGVVIGEDDCRCGRQGKYFKINGRLKDAELRGCSDTYATSF